MNQPQKRACHGLAALLVAGVGYTGVAMAQSSQVTLYGVVDMGLVHESGAAAGSVTKLTSGMMSGSRFGLKGQEDLGGGMSAFFTLEGGILVDNGASSQGGALFGRQALLGLKNAAGTVTLGRQYTTLAMAQVEFDPFITGMAGTSANLISAGGQGGNNRANNMIKYNLPSGLSGLNGELSYSFGEDPGGGSANSQIGAAIGYAQGDFAARLAYAQANDALGPGQDAKETFFGAKYRFDPVTAYVNYVVNRGAIVPGTPNLKSEDLLIGALIQTKVGNVHLSYIRKDDRTAANHDAQQFAVGFVYPLSKRTRLYTSYAHIRNKASNTSATGFYRVWNANDIGNMMAGNTAFNVGINHSF